MAIDLNSRTGSWSLTSWPWRRRRPFDPIGAAAARARRARRQVRDHAAVEVLDRAVRVAVASAPNLTQTDAVTTAAVLDVVVADVAGDAPLGATA